MITQRHTCIVYNSSATFYHSLHFLGGGLPFFCIELLSSRQKCLDKLTDQPSISIADVRGNYTPEFTLSFIFYSSKLPHAFVCNVA